MHPALASGSTYLHWGVVQISMTNALIIVGMVVVFVVALVLPFPGGRGPTGDDIEAPAASVVATPRQSTRSWTVRLRRRVVDTVPPGQWLPDRQPAYVRSWIYVFGVARWRRSSSCSARASCSPSRARPGGTVRPSGTS